MISFCISWCPHLQKPSSTSTLCRLGRLKEPECFWILNTGKMQWFHDSIAEENPSPLIFPPFHSTWPRSPRWSRWDARAPATRGTRCSWMSCPSLWPWWGMELQKGWGRRGGREANRVYLRVSPRSSSWQRAWFPFNQFLSKGLALHQQRAAGLQPCCSCLGAPWPHGKWAEIFSSTGALVARQQMVLICYYRVSNEIYSMEENTERNSSATYLL